METQQRSGAFWPALLVCWLMCVAASTGEDTDVVPEQDLIEAVARYEQLEAGRERLYQRMAQQQLERQYKDYAPAEDWINRRSGGSSGGGQRLPKAAAPRFALRPGDPGYYAASIAADADSGEMQAGSDITLRQNSPLLQLDPDQLQAPAHLALLQQVARLAALKQPQPQPQQVVAPLPVPAAQDEQVAGFPEPPPQLTLLKPAVEQAASREEQEQAASREEQEQQQASAEEEFQRQAEDPQQLQQDVRTSKLPAADDGSDLYFIAIVAGCSAAAIVGIIAIGISWYRLQKNAKAAADVEYPAYGVTGPNKEASPTGDRRLAQSAQMYHYQHQKQQIIAMESRTGANERPGSVSEAESDEEGEEGDYTVYECPGLAPTGEMEVKNPLFQDEPTPATPATKAPATPEKADQPPAQGPQQP